MNQINIFSEGTRRLQMTESIELTAQSLKAYGQETMKEVRRRVLEIDAVLQGCDL